MHDGHSLRHLAEQEMLARGFWPHPSPEALAEAEAPDPPGSEGDDAADLRDVPFTSIDNVESRDLDQLEAVAPAPGGTRLYVAIAEVAHLAPRRSAIDEFAGHNTTSVYTGVATFPMLPERLCFDRTSLLPGRPRQALVIETLIHDDGTLGPGRLRFALVRSRAQLDYPSVSAWLDGDGPAPAELQSAELREQIERQDALAVALRRARCAAGALDFESAEDRPVLDAEGRVIGLAARRKERASSLVEELMIASNRTVASVLDAAGKISLRRQVREPARWARIVDYAAQRGRALPEQPSPLALSTFLQEMRRALAPAAFAEVSLSIVKLMGRGEYGVHVPGAGDVGHFGLATSVYTHATAPNRRYPDLITQRIARAPRGAAPYAAEELAAIAERCSQREAAAQKVERRVRKSLAAQLLSRRVGERFQALVTGASDKGTWVRLLGCAAQAAPGAEHPPAAEGKVVAGADGLAVGDRVDVRLREVSVERGFIDFEAA